MPIESLQRAPATGPGQGLDGKAQKGQAAADPAFAALLALFMGTPAVAPAPGQAVEPAAARAVGRDQAQGQVPDPALAQGGDAAAAVSLDQALSALKSDPDLMAIVRLNPDLAKALQSAMGEQPESRPAAFGEILQALQVAVETPPAGTVASEPAPVRPDKDSPAAGVPAARGEGKAVTASPVGSTLTSLPAAGPAQVTGGRAAPATGGATVQARSQTPADTVQAMTSAPTEQAEAPAIVATPGPEAARFDAAPPAQLQTGPRPAAAQRPGPAPAPAPALPLAPAAPQPGQAAGGAAAAASPAAEAHTHGPALTAAYTPDQLVDAVARSAAESGQGHYTVTLRLHPEHLGEVRLQLQVNGREVHTVMQVAQPEARAALESRGERLRQGLDQAGLTLAGFQVSTGSGQSGRPGDRDRRDQLGSLPGKARYTTGPSGPSTRAVPGRPPDDRTRRSGRLDTIA